MMLITVISSGDEGRLFVTSTNNLQMHANCQQMVTKPGVCYWLSHSTKYFALFI